MLRRRSEPPIKPGIPDPYTPPEPGQLIPQEHLQVGPIMQYVTTLHYPDGGPPADVREHQPEHGQPRVRRMSRTAPSTSATFAADSAQPDPRPLLGRKIAGKSQRELEDLGLWRNL